MLFAQNPSRHFRLMLAARVVVVLLTGSELSSADHPSADANSTNLSAPSTRAVDHDSLERAFASALQANGKEALSILLPLDSRNLGDSDNQARACMIMRLSKHTLATSTTNDAFVPQLLAAYQEYWRRSLLGEHSAKDNEKWLLKALNRAVTTFTSRPAASMDDIEPILESLVLKRGYHSLFGVTSPLREFMIWQVETEKRYDVALPEGPQAVTVVLMDKFASLGWAGFATCDRQHTGGWAKPDRLYAVASAYDQSSEDYRVSYLAHEGQHFSDLQRFQNLTQAELEYRAKLTELALAKSTLYELLESFSGNEGDDIRVPHSYANGHVVSDMALRLGFQRNSLHNWRGIAIDRINQVAATLLREDTARLLRAHGNT